MSGTSTDPRREGSLEAPTRHPIDWQRAASSPTRRARHRARARLRHLSRLPPLLQPVQLVSDAVRCRRRDRRPAKCDGVPQDGVLGSRRPLLPVRHVLHDQVSVRAAASVERRLPASDAARQGVKASRTARRTLRDKILSATDAVGSSAGIPVVAEVVNAVNRIAARPQAAREDARRASRGAGAEVSLAARARKRLADRVGRAGASRSRPARRTGTGRRCSRPATAIATTRSSSRTSSRCSSTTASGRR